MKEGEHEKARVPLHGHCRVCGRPVPLTKEYCSLGCRNKAIGAEKRQRRITRFFTFMMAALLAVFLLLSLIQRPG